MKKSLKKVKNLIFRFKDLTALGIGNIITTGIGGIFWFYLASLVGVEHYGEISYFIAIAGIAGVIAMLGASNTITVYSAKGEKILPQASLLTIGSSICVSLVLFFMFYNIGASIYVVGYVIFGLVTSEILGRKLYKNYSIYIITQRVMMAGLSLLFYFLFGYQAVIIGISLSFFPYIIKIFHDIKNEKIKITALKSKRNFMINSYVLDLSRVLSSSTDKLVVAPMFGLTILGNYQLGIQFLSLMGLIPSIIYQYTLPHDASGNPNKKIKKGLMIISVVITILGITLAPLIIPILFPKFVKAINVIQITSTSIIPGSINLMYISKFLGTLKSKIVIIGSVIYITTQISGILILGKFFGINGIALSIVLAAVSESIYLVLIDQFIKRKTSN